MYGKMGVTQYAGSGGGISVTSNIPPSSCTAPDGTPTYNNPGTGETASSAALMQTATVPTGTFQIYNALMYGLKNNEPLTYYTTNSAASSALTLFGLTQASPAYTFGTVISTAITNYGNSGATTYFINWATSVTAPPPAPPTPPNPTYAGSTNSIYIIRAISQGYYNNSVLPPEAVPAIADAGKTSDTSLFTSLPVSQSSICNTGPSCETVWESNWNNYWTNLIKIQSANTYVIAQIPISDSIIQTVFSSSGNLCKRHPSLCVPPPCHTSYAHLVCIQQPSGGGGGTVTASAFTPMNISSDAAGDVYITGTINNGGVVTPWIIKLASTISTGTVVVTGKIITLANGKIPQDSSGHQLLPTEVAASPDGKLVFVTSQHSSDIFVLSGETLSYISTYNLVYSSDVVPLGITYQGGSGSSSAPSAAVPNVNITDWIANGGIYGQNTVNNGAISSIINNFKKNGITQLDGPQYHHPVAMQDVNGYLYVLDNWYGGIGKSCTFHLFFCWTKSNTANFDTLMLRVINSTGQDTPISPTTYDDVWFQTGTGSKATYQRYNGSQSSYYPPFGWIVSASVSDGSGSNIVNVCGLAISNYPCQTPTVNYISKSNYWPLGPSLSGLDCSAFSKLYGCSFLPLSGIGFSVNFNNTVGYVYIWHCCG